MDAVAARTARVAALKAQVDARLDALCPPSGGRLTAAMHYALSTPGKRLRPLLLLLTAAQLGQSAETALDAACAVEMVHAASLVLDDLPCMDDAAVRRGQPSTHARFGQDVAVLAGVALLNQAYALLARAGHLPAEVRLAMVEALSGAVGLEGLVAGQALDLHEPVASLAGLREAHHRKTGVLFMAAVTLGGLIGGASLTELLALERFAAELGLAFQARDDVSDAGEVQPDYGAARTTLISLLGHEGAVQEADGRLTSSKRALVAGGPRLEPLCAYVDLLMGERRVAEAAS
ncbi:polyprenyl synthetase family protein [Caulobacter sp. S45]|uniref:polyprenyl synthetase family protein n=1 Tax=Caulobacter sp. S45 TaxID=1641861 RepID=UPI00157694FB|nr:polyprenyl synthetase family protein [Caulobacter sp. S45]